LPSNIAALLRSATADMASEVWLRTETAELTYAAALEQVERAAAGLRNLGVRRGDRVIVTARNTKDYVLAWLGLMDLGAVQVPINPASSEPELLGFVAQVDPALVVTDRALAASVDAAIIGSASRAARAEVTDLFTAASDGRGPADVDPDDLAVMIPTSGTTGRSKLVMQTHRSYVMAAEGFPYWLRIGRDDRLMTSLPLFHLNAPAYSVLGSLAARASVVVLPAFSASGFLDAARRHGATEFNAIGAMLEILMRQPERSDDHDTPLRLCYTGPSPDRERQEKIEARFALEIVCGYALSESPYGLVWRHGTRPFGTLGSPRQHPSLGHVNDARVRDDGRDVTPGEIGELELRNPTVMRGYYEMPDETAAVLRGGWLRTGDLVVDNGDETYTFVGRAKDVIRRRGENLSPAEVEATLERHPDVTEAAVIAVPSELSEDEVKAFVIEAPDRRVDVDELRAYVAERLAPFKIPRYLEVVDALPHTPTGRLAKHQLSRERNTREVDFGSGSRQSR
jgi:crotonobetaine/carnitine-CoA ligase